MASSALSSDQSPTSADSGGSRRMIVLHVLCPSLQPPNRFTFKEIPLSTTVADLKTRISQAIPSRPPPENQRLIYRGKSLSNNGMLLQEILEPMDASEYTMHLVLPPAPAPIPTTSALSSSSAQGSPAVPLQGNPLLASGRFGIPSHTQNTEGIRFRGSVIPQPQGPNEAEIGIALRRNIEAVRRQIELQERGWPPGQGLQETATTTHANPLAPQPFTSSFPQPNSFSRASQNLSHPPPWTAEQRSSSASTSNTTMRSETASPTPSLDRASTASTIDSQLPEDSRLRLQILRQQVTFAEDQVNRGIAPPIDHIVRIRTQLFNILDSQYRNPLAQRDGAIESLLTRVFNIYTRADQLRVIESRSSTALQTSTTGVAGGGDPSRAPVYLLSSPNGYQALIASPGETEAIQSSFAALRSVQAPGAAPLHDQGPAANVHADPNAALIENAVRQAVVHQRLAHNGHLGLARNVRRLWLFIRLYLFCYMFSEPGTWSRIFLVTLAALITLLSETSVPRHLHRILVAPLQRHLEGLVHFAPDENARRRAGNGPNPPRHPDDAQATQNGRAAHASAAATDDRRAAVPGGWRQHLRRVERSLALFLASLVPGVGERHIEVRNAAERAREEEEERRRQQEAEREAEQEQGEGEQGPTEGNNITTENHENHAHTTIPQEDEDRRRA